jgi:hypothetical protein
MHALTQTRDLLFIFQTIYHCVMPFGDIIIKTCIPRSYLKALMNVKLARYIIIPKIMLDFRFEKSIRFFRTNSNQILYNIVKTKLTQLYEGLILTRVKLKWFSFYIGEVIFIPLIFLTYVDYFASKMSIQPQKSSF